MQGIIIYFLQLSVYVHLRASMRTMFYYSFTSTSCCRAAKLLHIHLHFRKPILLPREILGELVNFSFLISVVSWQLWDLPFTVTTFFLKLCCLVARFL